MSSPGTNGRKSGGKNISTFCRIKPSDDENFEIEYQVLPSIEDDDKMAKVIQFVKPIHQFFLNSSNGRRSQEYTFNEVFLGETAQSDIFVQVGKEVMDNALKGYNGTIFAYGQTATGKTYTIMGEDLETESTDLWGLVPRALNYIFDSLNETNHKYTVTISFLEIYKENMFDLLSVESFLVGKKTRLQKTKVFCKMDSDNVRIEGLRYKAVNDANDAMDIFLEGFENREVAETYANERSSRSHAVFTVYINREDDTGTVESKVHFVDLAGSERVGKDNLGDEVLVAEAKEINRSLLFLHKVIKSISSGKNPETFRNTMITKILRDSLIGNSMTSLIATISLERYNFDETLSTCEFAHSVSKIRTMPRKNKTEDLNRMLLNLQEENAELKRIIAEFESERSHPDQEDLAKRVLEFYNDDDPNSKLTVREHDKTSQFCFHKLKEIGKSDVKKVNSAPLTDEEKQSLDAKLAKFIGERGQTDTAFELGDNSNEAQYCINRLRHIIKEFDDRPAKKKGCC